MPITHTTKSSRLDARITPELRDLLHRVAARQGRSISDYVVTALQEAVRKDMGELDIIHLSRENSERFAAALLDPPRPAPGPRRQRDCRAIRWFRRP